MKRMLAMALVVIGAFSSNFASALGLGELKLNSALNEKFNAEITIKNIGDLSKNQIIPNLASHEDFSRAGVERVFFLTSLKFDVAIKGDGSATLKLKSDKIVREPFLNFLVEIHWPSGRLLREYTVLLDPPVFSEAPAAAVNQASTPPPEPKKTVKTQPTRRDTRARTVSAPTRSAAPRLTTSNEGGKVRVKKNDTLWGIAKENRPSGKVSVRQTMVAIQRQNPKAFINNNINLLKAGQVLRIPSEGEVLNISYDQALAETSRQNQEWRNKKKTIDTTRKEENNVQKTPQDVAVNAEEGQLKLVSDEEASSTDGLAENASGASVAGDESVAAGDDSSSTTSIAENVEASADADNIGSANIDSSVADAELRKQVEDLKRLLSLKDQQLALLQNSTVQVQNSTVQSETVAANEASLEENASETNTSEDTTAPVASEKKESNGVAGIIDMLKENPLYIGILVLAILVVLMVFGAVSRKRKQEEYPVDLKDALDHQDDVDFDESMEDDLADIVTDTEEQVDADSEEPSLSSVGEAENDEPATDDVSKIIEESDIYIAYGRYERAIEILQPAINDYPESTELRLKLAEIYTATNNQSGLSQLHGDLEAIGDQEALDQFEALTSQTNNDEPASMETLDTSEAENQTDDDETLDVTLEDELGAVDFELPEDSSSDAEVVENKVYDESDELADVAAELTDGDEVDFTLDDESNSEAIAEETTDAEPENADDMEFLGDTDESSTKLELAKAYIDMADKEAALDMLNEVIEEGNDAQKDEARQLLEKLG